MGVLCTGMSQAALQGRPRFDITIHDCYIDLTDIREQTAEAANNMLDNILSNARLGTEGCLRLFSDCGPHYRSGLRPALQKWAEWTVHHYIPPAVASEKAANICAFLW